MSPADVSPGHADIWADSVGQSEAVSLLRAAVPSPVHAYLFLGPSGTGKRRTARAFAAALLCADGGCGACRNCTLALRGEHPDSTEIEREGAAILRPQADEIIHTASMSPVEGFRKIVILDEFHLLHADAAARLLKTVEEPPRGTVFLILADQLVPDLITIASRCVRVPFHVLSASLIVDLLRQDGFDESIATEAATAAGGDLDRARLLANDPALFARREAFAAVPRRLDGTGTRVMQLVDELTRMIEESLEPLKQQHVNELAEAEDRAKQFNEKVTGKAKLDARHKRELRKHRTDEWRAGLGVIAAVYRDYLVKGVTSAGTSTDSHSGAGVHGRRGLADEDAVSRIVTAIDRLDRNPNEALLLQALLLTLPPVA